MVGFTQPVTTSQSSGFILRDNVVTLLTYPPCAARRVEHLQAALPSRLRHVQDEDQVRDSALPAQRAHRPRGIERRLDRTPAIVSQHPPHHLAADRIVAGDQGDGRGGSCGAPFSRRRVSARVSHDTSLRRISGTRGLVRRVEAIASPTHRHDEPGTVGAQLDLTPHAVHIDAHQVGGHVRVIHAQEVHPEFLMADHPSGMRHHVV